jgi:hypothetical protein
VSVLLAWHHIRNVLLAWHHIRNVLLAGALSNDDDAVVTVALCEAVRDVVENLVKRKVHLQAGEFVMNGGCTSLRGSLLMGTNEIDKSNKCSPANTDPIRSRGLSDCENRLLLHAPRG